MLYFILAWVVTPVLLALKASAQTAQQWTDPLTSISFYRHYDSGTDTAWGFVFPPLQPTSNEFIGFFIAPRNSGWIGTSLGGRMTSNLLILGWTNGATPIVSPRFTTAYGSPAVYNGPTLTVLGTSGVNATHQRIVYRCQACTTWSGGSNGINLNGNPSFGFVTQTSSKPNSPSDPGSSVSKHSLSGQFTLNTANAHSNSYSTWLSQLQNSPPLGSTTSTTTTSRTSTSTTSNIPTTTTTRTTTSTTSTSVIVTPTAAPNPSQWCDSYTTICFWRWYESGLDVSWGFLFPPLSPASTEFIGFFIAPKDAGWIGISLGGGMVNNLLVVGWVNGNQPVASVRRANNYQLPDPWEGSTITILGSSGVNATHQRIIYRCQECTSWLGGSGGINLTGDQLFGWALNPNIKPDNPSNPNSGLTQHGRVGLWSLNVGNAHSSLYNVYLYQLQNTPLLGGGTTTTSTSTTIATTPTSTSSTTSTTITSPTSTPTQVTGPLASQWCDGYTYICFWRHYDASIDTAWGYLFPSTWSNEFIGIFVAPITSGWVGSSLGGSMLENPLVLGWVDSTNNLQVSVRRATAYGPPSPYPTGGPTVTILGSSGVNATHQRILYRCQNCVSWSGGSGGIKSDGVAGFGYAAHTSSKPSQPGNPNSPISKHTNAGLHTLNTLNARSSLYSVYLYQLQNSPLLGGVTTTTAVSTSTSSTTSITSSTSVITTTSISTTSISTTSISSTSISTTLEPTITTTPTVTITSTTSTTSISTPYTPTPTTIPTGPTGSQWCDGYTYICFWRHYDATIDTAWGFLFPPLSPASTEFLGILVAPRAAGWVGTSLGGGMLDNPLVVGWVDGENPKISLRKTSAYGPPAPWDGGKLTILGTSGVNATHQRIVYRCEGCTKWDSGLGGIRLNEVSPFGFATHTSQKPTTPGDYNSVIGRHSNAGQFIINVAGAHSSLYNVYLYQLQNSPLLSGTITTTTSISSSSTTSTTSVTSATSTSTSITQPTTSTTTTSPTSTSTSTSTTSIFTSTSTTTTSTSSTTTISTTFTPSPTTLPSGPTASQWCDGLTYICFWRYYDDTIDTAWGYLFPPASPPSDEFIGIMIAPYSSGWVGTSLGGGMLGNPLVVGWVDNDYKAVISLRLASEYGPPELSRASTLTVLGSSGVNATHLRIVYRCQGCTKWNSGFGGIKLDGVSPFGYAAHINQKPWPPNDPDVAISRHTSAGQFLVNVGNAHSSLYNVYLYQLQNAPMVVPPPVITTTSTTTPTSTSTTTTSTVTTPSSTPTGEPATQWCDSTTTICFWSYYNRAADSSWGYLFPPLSPPSDEFIGILVAPRAAGWIGASLGGDMRNNPLVVGWLNGDKPVVSIRKTSSYALPSPLSGPTVTVLGSSGYNTTHQRIVYRCQGCVSWSGGSNGIALSGTQSFGFALHSSQKPTSPSDPNSSFSQHTLAGKHILNVAGAHTSLYNIYLTILQNAPPLTPTTSTTTTSTTTTRISTTTTSTTSTTTSSTTTVRPTPTGPLTCPGAPNPRYALNIASGWRATTVLGGLTQPRGIVIDTRGNLLVSERGKGVSVHTLNADGCSTGSKTLISDTNLNHGIDINVAGNKLAASSADSAWLWDYDPVSQTASNKRTLITGMYNAGHVTRTLLFSRKYPDLLVVAVGSDGNLDMPSFSASSGRAQLRVFDLRTLPTSGASITSSYGKVLGYGLRNDVGIGEDRAGIIHSIENSCDDAYRTVNGNRRDVHIDNPAEKVYRLGDPSNPQSIFGGYPYCFTVWDPPSFTDKSFQVGDWFVQAPNTTMNDAWCDNNAVKPHTLLPPHTAPLDMKFGLGSDTNMYASLHGSWNRNPPQGYRVVYTPGRFSASGEWTPTVGLAQTKTSYVDLLRNSNEGNCNGFTGGSCFRPVAMAWGQKGENLYVSSDTSGEVFLLKRNAGPTE